MIAANQATLTGNSLTNRGLFQAAQLNVNTQTITNSGTLLGNQGLTIKGNSLNNASGKVFSGGKRKLTAVCSHQTRIGNLDAHLI
ncbi:hypothetical protein MRS16_004873 [Escherichia coli]|nr:hypothetical protein [Escherichia coli]